nr:minichromosome maintenance complex component 6-like [Cryptomonas curvata]
MNLTKHLKKPQYYYDVIGEETKRVFYNFLKCFDLNKIFFSKKEKSLNFLQFNKIIIQSMSSTIFINFEHLIEFSDELSDVIQEQYIRVEPYLRRSLSEYLRNNLQKISNAKEFWISLYNVPNKKKVEIVDCRVLNKLISISGTVTKIADCYPKLLLGTFECSNVACGFKIWHTEQNFLYKEPKNCINCGNINWILITNDSIFVFIQKMRIQGIYSTFFHNLIYHSIDIYIKYSWRNLIKPGKKFIFSGSLIVLPTKKFLSKKISKDFQLENLYFQKNNFSKNIIENIYSSFYFWACHSYPYQQYSFKNKFYINVNETNSHIFDSILFYTQEKKAILKFRNNKNLFTNFINNFYSDFLISDELKAAVLLMFIGGKKKEAIENNIGNKINICVIDDKSFRKTELLKTLVKFFPGIIYVNTKNFNIKNSTSSLFNEIEIGGLYIQSGSVLISDKNLYCINNFNILNEKSQRAILKVIDYQNFPILKSRKYINLKTSIALLAFVQRRNKKKINSNEKNLNVTFNNYNNCNFDLCFPLTKTYSESNDYWESINITFKNFKKINTFQSKQRLYLQDFQFYLYFVRFFKPIFIKNTRTFIVKLYNFLRKQITVTCSFLNSISIKHLETLIKLTEAISKFYSNIFIEEFHIKAAARLLIFSLSSCTYQDYFSFKKQKKLNFIVKTNVILTNISLKNKLSSINNSIIFKVTSKEFYIIYKKLVRTLKHSIQIGIVGLALPKLLLKMTKTSIFIESKITMIIKLTKILLIIRNLLLKQTVLFMSKYQPNPNNHYYVNIFGIEQHNLRTEQESNLCRMYP